MNAFAQHGDPNRDHHCKWCGKKLSAHYRSVEPPRVWVWEPAQAFDLSGKLYVPDPEKGTTCRTLDKVPYGKPSYGYMSDGTFCTATCGWLFGRQVVANGHRLRSPKKP